MERDTKTEHIGQIRARFDKMTAAVFLDYKGMTVEHATKLRDEFRKAGVEYKVCKNTLVKQALKGESYVDKLSPALRGMTGIAWSYDDPSAAAKVVKAFKKDAAGEKLQRKVQLARWVVMPSQDWYSGDPHVHSPRLIPMHDTYVMNWAQATDVHPELRD